MSSTRRRVSCALLALTLAGALAACGSEEEGAPSGTPADPGTTSAAPSTSAPEPGDSSPPAETEPESPEPPESTTPPSDEPPAEDLSEFTADAQTSEGWPVMTAEPTYLTQVRAAAQDGYDRVVLEFRGSVPPSYDVRYVDEAIAEGSGAPLEVEGAVFLRVDTAIVVNPVDVGDDPGSVLTGPSDLGDAAISGLISEGPWEGHSATHVGLDGVRDFRVSTLTDPARIVVDIKR